MPKKFEFTYTVKIELAPGEEPVPWDSLTEEKKQECLKIMSENISRTASAYYSNHLDEFERLWSRKDDFKMILTLTPHSMGNFVVGSETAPERKYDKRRSLNEQLYSICLNCPYPNGCKNTGGCNHYKTQAKAIRAERKWNDDTNGD